MQSLYTLPAVLLLGIPLVNSQITSAPPKINRFSFSYLLDQFIFMCSTAVLVNSKAGMKFFYPPREKSKLIYNGLNLKRFDNLTNKEIIKKKYHIKTKYAVIMVATVSPKKDYDLFFKIAENILQQRNDITFIGVGPYYEKDPMYQKIKRITEHPRLIFTGMINEVEALVNACDIGVLFSPQGEGLSNTILEYMALGKPVVANDLGGNKELIITGKNGFLVERPSVDEISEIILSLIKNRKKCEDFGETSKQIIAERFNIEKMGRAFAQVYTNILDQHTKKTILFSEQ
jgi:glycosyltransferase involved in cell wall biosynthesis